MLKTIIHTSKWKAIGKQNKTGQIIIIIKTHTKKCTY